MKEKLSKVEATTKEKTFLEKYSLLFIVTSTLFILSIILLSFSLYLKNYASDKTYQKIADGLSKAGIDIETPLERKTSIVEADDPRLSYKDAPSHILYKQLENGKYLYRVYGEYMGGMYDSQKDSNIIIIPVKTVFGQEILVHFVKNGSLFFWPWTLIKDQPARFSGAVQASYEGRKKGYIIVGGEEYLNPGDLVDIEWRVTMEPKEVLANEKIFDNVFFENEIPVTSIKGLYYVRGGPIN